MKELNHRTMLKNGVTLSIQASAFHYCEPLTDDLEHWEDYKSVEVGFILDQAEKGVKPPPSWLLYADDQQLPSAIYAYVPVNMVKDFIADNGGFKKFVIEPFLIDIYEGEESDDAYDNDRQKVKLDFTNLERVIEEIERGRK